MTKKKYSIVFYLGGESYDRVRDLQQKMFELTGSRECLDSWQPHFTLGDGIWVDDAQLDVAEKKFQEIVSAQKSFRASLQDFGGRTDRTVGDGEITTPFVLWIDMQIQPVLLDLVEKIKHEITSQAELWYRMPQPYVPHVTIAFRDLTEEGYYAGLEYLKKENFEDAVTVDHVALVEHLPEKDVEYKKFPFQG